MRKDTIVLETAFVRIPSEMNLEQLWRSVDEQQLPASTRRILSANGLRVGVVGTQIPAPLQDLLETVGQGEGTDPTQAITKTDLTSVQQQLQSRSGERSELVVVPEIPEQTVVLLNDEGNIRAIPFPDGQGLLAIRTHPAGDGTARVELTPEIKYGEVRQQWVPGNGTFRYDVGRHESSFEQLRFDAVLSPGQTLLVTTTDQPKGLGGLFFGQNADVTPGRLVLLVRLARTQYDDLFSPQVVSAPFATPLE